MQKSFLIILLFSVWSLKVGAQVVIYTAKSILVCDTAMHQTQAMAVENGMILATGKLKDLKKNYNKPIIKKFKNAYIYPGFIDAHCHFLAYCRGLKECNLFGSKSVQEVVDRLKAYQSSNVHPWIIGRGWDQNLWPGRSFPTAAALDAAFPNVPVVLKRVDGHAAWLNSKAIAILKIDPRVKVKGGEFVYKNGEFTGVLVDNALDLVLPNIPDLPKAEMEAAMIQGQNNCLAYGLTTLSEAGLKNNQINWLDTMQKAGKLQLRIYAMMEPNTQNIIWAASNKPYQSQFLHVGGFKFYLDGALGSRGALLKHPYCDRTAHSGLLLSDLNQYQYNLQMLQYNGWQVCTHAIGDSANAIALKEYRQFITPGSTLRWRIEHAQIVDTNEMKYFDGKNIIPSVQPTHATSDAPWAANRICKDHLPEAYAYETLRKNAGMVALGTDFPVEDISTIKTFYSAVFRLDVDGYLDSAFLPNQALSAKNALLGMTFWAAYANKEETTKGSLEAGKVADFVVLDKNWLTAKPAEVKKTKVLETYIHGASRYHAVLQK